MYADEYLAPWFRALSGHLPEGGLFDAHTHTGHNDPDGFRLSAADLVASLELAGARAAVFTMHEPDGYPPANDRVISEAEASQGRLVPFCRLDPARDPLAEAERCLAAGARGIKLHPRAEGFRLDTPAVGDVFALAGERRLPIVIHAGRGIPALGRDVLALSERFPDARPILAHAGISDLAWIWRRLGDHPNVFFDTAWWSPVDLVALFSLVPPGRILFASDAPYGTTMSSACLAFRCAIQAGLGPEAIASVAGAQAQRLIAGEDPLDLGPAPGPDVGGHDLLLERVGAILVTVVARMMMGDPAEEAIALVRLACEVGDDAPEAPVCRSVLALVDRHARYAEELRRLSEEQPGEGRHFLRVHLILLAACVARTPAAPLPEGIDDEAVGERAA